MIDPLSALGLASNIFQLLEQGIKAAVACNELYKRGSVDANNEIDRYAQSISIANKELETVLNKQEGPRANRARRLQNIANEAYATAEDLKKVLNNLKLSKSQWKGAFKTSLKSILKKGTIDRIRAKLEQQDQALRSALLKDQYIKAFEDEGVRQSRFEALSEGQKDIIVQVLRHLSLASDASLAATRTSEAAITFRLNQQDIRLDKGEAAIMNRFDSQDALMETHHAKTIDLHDHVRESVRRQILDALAFSEMNERRNMIEKRVRDFGDTYTWIFKCADCVHHSPHDACMQPDFVKWLYSGTEIFWISGKPGSGKSQLMEFIFLSLNSNDSASEPLEAWASTKRIHVLDFWFFKPATSVLLRTIQGFWRSLCFQILDKDKSLVEKVVQNGVNVAPESLKSSLQPSGTSARSWTDRELSSWFTYLLSVTEHSYLLLLDGLDENTDDHEGLLETVHHLARNSKNIKICCSSRPEPLFVRSLRNCPMLRLQDLNFADIRSYCSKRLDKTRAAVHASNIAKRAEGVFLWAYLVAEDLRRGSLQGDSDKDLEQRLSETPTEMNELFEFMLKRQDRFYLKYPKPYLLLLDAAVQISAYPSLFQLLLASKDLGVISSQVTNGPETEFLTDLNESARNMQTNVVANCAGLVETERDLDPMEAPFEFLVEASCVGLKFIHRCVQDFLLESESGAHFLRSCNVPKKEAIKRLMTASALGYIMSTASIFFAEALEYAEHITPESWTSSETYILDTLFYNVYSRLKEGREEPDTSTNIECLQLSELENLVFGHAAYRRLVPYLEARLKVTDREKSTSAAGLVIAATLRHWERLDADMAKMIQPYISWTQCVTLCYHVVHLDFRITASRPLWQYYYLGCLNTVLHDGDAIKSPVTFLDIDLESIILDNNSNEASPIVTALLIAAPHWELFPDPENNNFDETFQYYEAFKVNVLVHVSGHLNRPMVDFEQCSPIGLSRFLKIEPNTEESLHQAFKNGVSNRTGDPEYHRCTTNILNDNLSNLSAIEIADVVCFGRAKLFSNGQFLSAEWAEVDEYVSRLQNGKFSEDFSSGQDPILLAILQRESEKMFLGTSTDGRIEEIEDESREDGKIVNVDQDETINQERV